MPPFVSVVILNYNGLQFLDTCLGSLLRQDYEPFEIILVDNASTDGSVDYAAHKFPQVHLIVNPHNLGFAAGNNVGIRCARGQFLFILNADTETAPGVLRELVAPMLADESVGVTTPKLLQFQNRTRLDAAGLSIDRAGIGWNLERGRPDDHEVTPRQVFGASASAALYRTAMLDEIGLFDEDYFAYYEDVDLAWRARLSGWKCLYVPQAVVYHVHGASFRKFSALRLYLLGRNKWWTILKNYSMPQFAYYLPWIILLDLASVSYSFIVRRELNSLRGRLAAVRGFQRMWCKRRTIQSQRRVGFSELVRWMK